MHTHSHAEFLQCEGALAFHSMQECKRRVGAKERRRETGTFPRILEKGGREEADSGSDRGQEQIQEEGKWMGCLVYGLVSLSHSGNDPVITAHCVKEVVQHDTEEDCKNHMKCISEIDDKFPSCTAGLEKL